VFKLLEGHVDVEEGLEGRGRELNREHNGVDGETGASHPEHEQHHRQLAQRRFGECPRFLQSQIKVLTVSSNS